MYVQELLGFKSAVGLVRAVKEVKKSGILLCCGYGWSVLFFVVSTAGGYVWCVLDVWLLLMIVWVF